MWTSFLSVPAIPDDDEIDLNKSRITTQVN